jgi:hypothetical protein
LNPVSPGLGQELCLIEKRGGPCICQISEILRMASSGILRRVALVRTDVSEELSASFIRVTRIGELGTTPAVTSNRPHSASAAATRLWRGLPHPLRPDQRIPGGRLTLTRRVRPPQGRGAGCLTPCDPTRGSQAGASPSFGDRGRGKAFARAAPRRPRPDQWITSGRVSLSRQARPPQGFAVAALAESG